MLAIYRTAWSAMTQNFMFYLIFAALFVGADLLQTWMDSSPSVMLVPWFIASYFLHRLLLLGEGMMRAPTASAVPPAIGKFLLIALLLVGLSMGPALWLLIEFLFATPNNREEELFAGVAFLSVMLFLLVYWVVLAAFGTALPAAAVGDRFGLRLTLRRARRTALGIAGGLMVGPALFATIVFVGLVGVLMLVDLPFDAPEGWTSFSEIFLSFAVNILALFNATLTVAVLCRAYRKVAPAEIAALLTPEGLSSRGASAQTPA